MRARHARTEVTGVSLLRQNFLALVKLVSARTLADLKKVSPGDADSLNHSLSDNLYGREKLSIFDREFMTEVEFHALFAGDEAALDRIGVRSVAELMMYVDVTGKPRLHFSQQDLDKLNARGLSDDSCIKVQDTYFKPTARRKTGDSVRARVRAQRLGAGERVRGGA